MGRLDRRTPPEITLITSRMLDPIPSKLLKVVLPEDIDTLLAIINRDVPIPFFPSRYRLRYLGSGYRPIPSTDPIPRYVSGYTALCTTSPV